MSMTNRVFGFLQEHFSKISLRKTQPNSPALLNEPHQQVITTITNLVDILADEISSLPEPLRLFTMVVHDWLAHLVGKTFLLSEYDISLFDICNTHIQTDPRLVHYRWEDITADTSVTYNGVKRYTLLTMIVKQDIALTKNYSFFYAVVLFSLVPSPSFAAVRTDFLPSTMTRDNLFISHLMQHHYRLREIVREIGMSDHVAIKTTDHVQQQLNSLGLLYGLSLCNALFIVDTNVYGDDSVYKVSCAINEALLCLKGVFDNV